MMRAQVFQFAPIFTEHMVLQRDACNAVFGIGTPGDVVTVCVPERAIRGLKPLFYRMGIGELCCRRLAQEKPFL